MHNNCDKLLNVGCKKNISRITVIILVYFLNIIHGGLKTV